MKCLPVIYPYLISTSHSWLGAVMSRFLDRWISFPVGVLKYPALYRVDRLVSYWWQGHIPVVNDVWVSYIHRNIRHLRSLPWSIPWSVHHWLSCLVLWNNILEWGDRRVSNRVFLSSSAAATSYNTWIEKPHNAEYDGNTVPVRDPLMRYFQVCQQVRVFLFYEITRDGNF